MDVSGAHQLDVSHHIVKKPLDKHGNVIGKEVTQEMGQSLREVDLKAAAQNATGGAAAAESTPPPTPLAVPAVDPTKVPGYCGSCYGAGAFSFIALCGYRCFDCAVLTRPCLPFFFLLNRWSLCRRRVPVLSFLCLRGPPQSFVPANAATPATKFATPTVRAVGP